jgi:hypothetical protein
MATQLRKVRILVASPGDVQSERDQLFKVVNELNLTLSALAPEKGIVLELVRWETHVHPGLGSDAQQVVNEQIGDYDVFVGIMWKRMGTPTITSQSGTDEEFQRAYRKWQENKSLPVLFYFCQQSFPPPRGAEDVEQLGKVVAFRNELSSKGLVADYEDHESFADVVRVTATEDSFARFLRHCARYLAVGTRTYPRGVFRFRSLQEAQEARKRVAENQ